MPQLARAVLLVSVSLSLATSGRAQQAPRPGSEPWTIPASAQSSVVYARDGSLIGEIGREWRTSVSIRSLPRYVGHAFVAVEDKRFYQHNGVDLIGIAGAMKDAVLGDARGASTITQQLVRNLHPDIISASDKSAGRKLREQQAALEMERHYSKEQILEAYLNQIAFSHGWYGIDEAARHYFGKPASQLTLAEAATLAAMPRNPGFYDPAKHPDHAQSRRNLILDLMVGQNFIDRRAADDAKSQRVITAPDAGMFAPSPYFVDVVRVQAERAGVPVSQGGYRIHTTLDPSLQRAATAALVEGILAVEQRADFRRLRCGAQPKAGADCLEGMVVAIDPSTGDVRALVGGRDHATSPFNRAVNAMRQPGSAFKPIVYAAAIAESLPPNAIVMDTMLAVPLPNGSVYSPENSDGQFLGALTLREALVRSRNPVAVQLFLRAGADTIQALAKRLGIDAPIAPYPSSAIGASVVQPLDLVRAYGAFAALGTTAENRFVVRIEDNTGKTVWAPTRPAPTVALDSRVAFVVRDMMRDVVERGTATAIRKYVPSRIPVAGKTGTTNDNSDVWFVGMTPDIVAGVWLGFDKPKTITPGAVGGTLAAPIFGRMISQYYTNHAVGTWIAPDDVVAAEVDRVTGALANANTPADRRQLEYFLPGTEPAVLKYNVWRMLQFGPVSF